MHGAAFNGSCYFETLTCKYSKCRINSPHSVEHFHTKICRIPCRFVITEYITVSFNVIYRPDFHIFAHKNVIFRDIPELFRHMIYLIKPYLLIPKDPRNSTKSLVAVIFTNFQMAIKILFINIGKILLHR